MKLYGPGETVPLIIHRLGTYLLIDNLTIVAMT